MRTTIARLNVKLLSRQRGLTLIELMIACTIGLLIVLAMSYLMINSLESRNELAKTSQQIENGRYAMDELRKEIQLAGFYSSFVPTNTVNWTTPDPCATTSGNLEFAAAPSTQNVPVGLQGFTQADAPPTCIMNRLDGTDILVVRRTHTEAVEIDVAAPVDEIDSGIDASLGEAFYLQVSNCPDLAMEPAFVVSNAANVAAFNLHKVTPVGANCNQGYRSEIRRYATHIFYVSRCNNCSGDGDGIPMLMMMEVSPNPIPRPIAEGIQNMQIEYGFDINGDGAPDVFADTVSTGTPELRWRDVVAVKVFMLARNVDPTPGHTDTKRYVLSSDGSEVGPFDDQIRRQVYVSTTMAHNIAGRRF